MAGLQPAVASLGWLQRATWPPWLALLAACFWSIVGWVSVPPAFRGPSVAVLASRLTVPSAEGCFGWLNRRGYAGA